VTGDGTAAAGWNRPPGRLPADARAAHKRGTVSMRSSGNAVDVEYTDKGMKTSFPPGTRFIIYKRALIRKNACLKMEAMGWIMYNEYFYDVF
jgi:hypothetical protein